MSIQVTTQTFPTAHGLVEGVKLTWGIFSLLLVTAPRGFLACGIFDLNAIEHFGRAAALVESSPDNPIGTLERFMERKITAVNEGAKRLGVTVGMSVPVALEHMF